MRSPIDNDQYVSKRSFELEQSVLFKTYWIFATLKMRLSQPYSFVVRDIGGVSVVVQNVDGEIIAYENSCPHRRMQLQWEESGTRPITCRFHGWSFGKDGKPKSIPHYDSLYQFDEESLNRLCLKKFAVQTVGQFVFVNLSATLGEEPLPIDRQFKSEMLERLESMSAHFDGEILRTTVNVNANWKLPLEIIQDPNHVQFLHARTLAKLRPMPKIENRGHDFKPYARQDEEPTMQVRDLSVYGESPRDEHFPEWFNFVERYGTTNVYRDIIIISEHACDFFDWRSFILG
jgi:phenylpropionate dioxygenase-like ring-hydroxylating dioxygenase large terminal subunit